MSSDCKFKITFQAGTLRFKVTRFGDELPENIDAMIDSALANTMHHAIDLRPTLNRDLMQSEEPTPPDVEPLDITTTSTFGLGNMSFTFEVTLTTPLYVPELTISHIETNRLKPIAAVAAHDTMCELAVDVMYSANAEDELHNIDEVPSWINLAALSGGYGIRRI